MPHYLVVANQTLTSRTLLDEIRARHADNDCDFHIVVPATRLHIGATWTEGQAIAHARHVLDYALARFRTEGIDATGNVGDENPVLAVADAFRQWLSDEIIVSTLAPGASKWLKRDLPHRLARRFRVPVTHITESPALVG
jgi:GABA permease